MFIFKNLHYLKTHFAQKSLFTFLIFTLNFVTFLLILIFQCNKNFRDLNNMPLHNNSCFLHAGFVDHVSSVPSLLSSLPFAIYYPLLKFKLSGQFHKRDGKLFHLFFYCLNFLFSICTRCFCGYSWCLSVNITLVIGDFFALVFCSSS